MFVQRDARRIMHFKMKNGMTLPGEPSNSRSDPKSSGRKIIRRQKYGKIKIQHILQTGLEKM
jgi:hypothetical protein